jgi:hypothetical protein
VKTLCSDVCSRCGDDNLCINKFLVEFGILPLFVRSGHKGVALVLQPFPKAKLVLRRTEQTGLLFTMLVALYPLSI